MSSRFGRVYFGSEQPHTTHISCHLVSSFAPKIQRRVQFFGYLDLVETRRCKEMVQSGGNGHKEPEIEKIYEHLDEDLKTV
jgi:hypothetical protein